MSHAATQMYPKSFFVGVGLAKPNFEGDCNDGVLKRDGHRLVDEANQGAAGPVTKQRIICRVMD